MTIGAIAKLDTLKCTTPALTVRQIQNASVITDTEFITEYPAGHTDPMFIALKTQRPAIRLSSTQLDTILAAVGVGGGSLATGVFYLKAGADTGAVARASLLHETLTMADGVIFWERISLPHNEPGTIDLVLAANYNGTNNPITYAGTVALDGNLSSALHFGAGPVTINGTSVTGVKNIEISSGVQLTQEGSDSELWPTWTGIMEVRPTITVQTMVPQNFNTWGIDGTALNSTTGITCYARKFSNIAGGRVADITPEHIKFVGADGSVVPESTDGDGRNPMTDTIRIELMSDTDSNRPLVITTSTAIT